MDLKQHLLRQMAFSHATFGPGIRTKGVVNHIRKELIEVLDGNGDSYEWVDVVILALDGLTRQLAYCNGERANPEQVAKNACQMILSKQARNEARPWPDYRTADTDKAIEHIKAEKPDCKNCKYFGHDMEDAWCEVPELLKEYPHGLNLATNKIECCPAPSHPMFEALKGGVS